MYNGGIKSIFLLLRNALRTDQFVLRLAEVSVLANLS